tara:strand:+ start:2303 stop:2512 length:210 start_codon:yes stop_codon:yes gene_type:complete
MKITATDLNAFPLTSTSFDSLEAFALVASSFDPDLTIVEVEYDGEEDILPLIDMDLTNALRPALAAFVA